MSSAWGCTVWWAVGAGRGPGSTVIVVEGSQVPGSVWAAAVVVCGGWMTGRLEMKMLTRVWTGSCWVAAAVVAAAAGWRGAWVVVGGGSWPGLEFVLGQCRLGLCRRFVVLWAAWGGVGVVLLLVVRSFGRRLGFGVGFSFGVRFEVEEDLGPEVCGRRCRAGAFPGVLPGCLGRLCRARGVPSSPACGRSLGFCRGLVDEVGGEGAVGG